MYGIAPRGLALTWGGTETVLEIAKRLSRRERVLVLLPPGLHHTLCMRLGGADGAHGLDVTLDADRFERLTRIEGLRELEHLREPLERAGMSLRVRTPRPQLLFVPRAASRADLSIRPETRLVAGLRPACAGPRPEGANRVG